MSAVEGFVIDTRGLSGSDLARRLAMFRGPWPLRLLSVQFEAPVIISGPAEHDLFMKGVLAGVMCELHKANTL